MKFLLNENIAPSFSNLFRSIGWDSVHVVDIGLKGKPDVDIVQYAIANELVIVTHDLDYGRIVSLSGFSKPSVLTFRLDKLVIEEAFKLVEKKRLQIIHYLQNGALVTIDDDKIRFRTIPVHRG